MAMNRLSCGLALALAIGCGSAQKTATGPGQGDGAPVSIEKAALPYKILRARGGTELDEATFMGELEAASAVCIGENHKNPHHHWAQLHLFDKLSAKNGESGRETALGMEMFQRPFQGVLNDFAAGRIDEKAMLSRTGYQDRWGFDWGFYAPTVAMAVARKAALLALNTERELTKRVSRNGIAALTDAERAKLPELNVEDPVHRAWWNAIMGDMSHPAPEEKGASDPHATPKEDAHGEDPTKEAAPKHGAPKEEKPEGAPEKEPAKEQPGNDPAARPNDRAEWIYTAQVLWDETMADGAATWLAGAANRQVVVLAGNGHCHDSGIVSRIKRRSVSSVVSVRPIIDLGDGELAAQLATPENDYLFVMTLPGK